MQAAIIGIGRWGTKILNHLSGHFKVKVRANSKTDLGEIWHDPDIEAVVIATPVETHYQLVREALLHGKHVFCEKPLTTKTSQAEELRDIAAKHRLVLVTDYIVTFSPKIQRVAKENDNINRFYSFRYRMDYRPELNVLHALLCHDLAILDMFRNLDGITFTVNNGVCVLADARGFVGRLFAGLGVGFNETTLLIDGVLCDTDEHNLIDKALEYFKRCIDGEDTHNIDRAIRVTRVLEGLANSTPAG